MLGWSTSASCSNMVWIFSWEGGCGHGVVGVGGPQSLEGWASLTSWVAKAFLSPKCNSFHTTSTPSSVSMARKVLWTPGMFPWFTWQWGKGVRVC